ncbi:MAG: M24 family metallopeptidase [Eubacteriaceae bacterium]|nr:M24 family metallopeptidase [Eubacteriaceae bacterium]
MTDFFVNNRKKLIESLNDKSLLAVFSGSAPHRSADAYYFFDVNKNFYYLTGIEREKFIYAAVKTKEIVEEFLFIEKADPVLEKWTGKKMTKEEATDISGIKTIYFLDEFHGKVNSLVASNNKPIENVALDMYRNAFDDKHSPAGDFASYIKEKYPQLKIDDISKKFAVQRFIKSDSEVQRIRKAVTITKNTFELLLEKAPMCTYEYELEAYLDFSFKFQGTDHAFDTIAASGKNATVLHYVDNNSQMTSGDLVMFDFGARYENYCADISRTFPLNGKFNTRQKQVYNVVLETLKETSSRMKPGISMKEINEFAKDMLAEGAIRLGLIKEKSEIGKYYYHGIGHPLGLDTHDVGDREMVLKPGMVYTCEPGLYIEEEGIGIRIEDDILITENGSENLSKEIIKEVDEIEAFMANAMRLKA